MVLKDALLYVICAFGAISQVFLIVAFIKDPLKCFRNPATYLIVTLAVSDFLACLGTRSYVGQKNGIVWLYNSLCDLALKCPLLR
jgi:hypothetical protein